MKLKYITYSIVAILIGLTVSSCIPNYDEEYQQFLEQQEAHRKRIYEQYVIDSTLIVDYLETNDSIADFDSTYGIFYHILETGESYHPVLTSAVTVKYKGMLLDSISVFDQTEGDETAQFLLGNLISGWQIGLQKIGSGGKIILYLPSVYGFGELESNNIPANSVLMFDIDLVSFY